MHYYNEHDKNAAAWLQELIAQRLIPSGEVDERSIEDVTPAELSSFTQCHFFAGIGGWSEALQLACIQPTRRLWTGSCPCQPFSTAGKGAGTADERHLWPAFKWLIEQCRPPTVFGEQVASAAGREWLAGVRSDLEGLAYEVGAADLCAAGVGAPHIRQRLFWVAHHQSQRKSAVAGSSCEGILLPSGHSPDGGLVLSYLSGREPGRVATATTGHGRAIESAGSISGVGDTRRQRDEFGRGAGDVGCAADQEQGEARERQRSRDADSGAGFDDAAFWGDGRTPNTSSERRERRQGSEERSVANGQDAGRLEGDDGTQCIDHIDFWGLGNSACRQQWGSREPGEIGRRDEPNRGSSAWSDFTLVPCRDGKARRIESGSQPLVDGIPRGVVSVGAPSFQEAQATGEARVARLKGYGNAIVPPLAAEFILAAEAAWHDRVG